jgi:RNA polymerase-binding transcription factor DksA
MNQEAVAELLAAERVSVLERMAGLERELAAIIESSGPAGPDDEHDPEGATVAFERQHLAALVSQARGHLAQIDAAMLRLADGSYGICESCGQPISEARLAARPVTTLCITCAARRLIDAGPALTRSQARSRACRQKPGRRKMHCVTAGSALRHSPEGSPAGR